VVRYGYIFDGPKYSSVEWAHKIANDTSRNTCISPRGISSASPARQGRTTAGLSAVSEDGLNLRPNDRLDASRCPPAPRPACRRRVIRSLDRS
jgi:hypothetical protein